MSRGIIEAQTLRSEQFEFEARTSDPGDAQPGEYWIRTDQTSTNPDVIAQLRRQDTSGVTTCPIFAAAEESNLGADVTRGPSVVLDDASVGFVAMTTGSGAVGSPRAVNSAGTEYVSHNALELNPIPDAQNLYADYNPAKQSDAIRFVDQAGTAFDLTANGDPTLQSDVFGSNNGIDLDGSGDFYVGASAYFGTLSQPYTIYFVFQNDDGTSTGERVLMNAETENEIIWDGRSGKNDWKFRGTNQHTFGQDTPFYNDIVSVWDGPDSVIEADGSEKLSGVNIGSVDLDGFILGQRRDDTRRWDGRLGRVLVYDAGHDSQTRSDVRSHLSDEGWI